MLETVEISTPGSYIINVFVLLIELRLDKELEP